MGDVCIWDALTGACIGNRASAHTGPVRAVDMRRRRDGVWLLCSGGEDWRVCVSCFGELHSLNAAGGCCIEDGGTSFTIDCRVRSICISPWADDFNLCIVGSQTGRIFSISLKHPRSLICSLLLDSPDIDHLACSPDFVFCCGRNGAVLRVPIASLTASMHLPAMQQQPLVSELPAVSSLCIDPTHMRIICLHGSSVVSQLIVSPRDTSSFRVITHSIWASTLGSSSSNLPTSVPPPALSSTSCLASDAGFVAIFGCRGDAVLIRDDGHLLQLLPQPTDSNRFYLCCCNMLDDSVLCGSAIRSNGTIFGFRANDAARGDISCAEFGVLNRLGRCSALDSTAVGQRDMVVCAGSIAGTLILYCGRAGHDDGKSTAVADGTTCGNENAVLIMKKLHGVKPVSCIRLVRDRLCSALDSYSINLFSAGHDGCIVSTSLRVCRGNCQVIAQQRVCNFDSAPIVALKLSSGESGCIANATVNYISIQNGRVFHSHGTFSLPAPPTTVGMIDQHRFSTLAAACAPSAIVLAHICKGRVRVMAADVHAGSHRILPGIHTDIINDIGFVCFESADRDPGCSNGPRTTRSPPATGGFCSRAVMCTVSTDGCCCIFSTPLSSASNTENIIVISRLQALASQVAGSALTCVKVEWLGDRRALIIAGGAFSCVHCWLLLFHPPDNGGFMRLDVISHASHICNACDDEGKCVSAVLSNSTDSGAAGASIDDAVFRISACLNDGRVVALFCLVNSQGSISILPTEEAPLRFSHAILCVASDSQGHSLFGLSNGCLRFADQPTPQSMPLSPRSSSAHISIIPPPPLPVSRCAATFPSEFPAILPQHSALHIAGLNALLPLDHGLIMCGGEDGCLSVVSLGIDRRLNVHERRRVSDGAVKRLLLLRCRKAVGGRVIEVDICVICHNQRCLTVSVQLQGAVSASCDDLLTGCTGAACHAQFKSVSSDVILDVGKSSSACVVGGVVNDCDLNSLTSEAHVVVGGWGVQTIRM